MAILKEMKHSARFTQQPHAVLVLLLEQIPAAPSTPPKPFAVVYAADMAADALIDTGAILALLDRSDRWHRVCVDAFAELRLPLLTSEAVLTALFHLVGDSRVEMEAAWKFIRSGAVVLGSIEHAELPAVHTLMSRYWDRPMDFADATLVYLANRESLSAILTIDHADFATYRIQRNRGFRVLPAIRP